jgi:hypothetical protein
MPKLLVTVRVTLCGPGPIAPKSIFAGFCANEVVEGKVPTGNVQIKLVFVVAGAAVEVFVKEAAPFVLSTYVKLAAGAPAATVTDFETSAGHVASLVTVKHICVVPGPIANDGFCTVSSSVVSQSTSQLQVVIFVPTGVVEESVQSTLLPSPASIQSKSAVGAVACIVNVALPAKGPLEAVTVTVVCSLKQDNVSRSAVVALPAPSVVSVIVAVPPGGGPPNVATNGLLLEKMISSLDIGWLPPSVYKANTSISCCPDNTVGGVMVTVMDTGATAG